MLRSASLSAPICDAQFRSIPEARRSRWTRRRAGPGGPAPGGCGRPWFRPVFGDRDEIAFPFRLSRENGAVPDLLGDFEGTLLSDGNQACAASAPITLARVSANRGEAEANAGGGGDCIVRANFRSGTGTVGREIEKLFPGAERGRRRSGIANHGCDIAQPAARATRKILPESFQKAFRQVTKEASRLKRRRIASESPGLPPKGRRRGAFLN